MNALILAAWLSGSAADVVSTERALAACVFCAEANPLYRLPPAARVTVRSAVAVGGGLVIWKGLRSKRPAVRWGTAVGASVGAWWYYRTAIRNMQIGGLR